MKILAESETVSIESDDEGASVEHAAVLLDVFSQYELRGKKPDEHTVVGIQGTEYHCYQRTLS